MPESSIERWTAQVLKWEADQSEKNPYFLPILRECYC